MRATDFLFPPAKHVRAERGKFVVPAKLALTGVAIPPWLKRRLADACKAAGVALTDAAGAVIDVRATDAGFGRIRDAALRPQAYRLTLAPNGNIAVAAPGPEGLRHGIITLALLLEAKAAGAALEPVTLEDAPAYRVRGIQVDLARQFFPPMSYLRKIVDRMADLKLNTLWLYLENHFRAPGMEDISPRRGMTPDQARAISAYAAARGIDVVPGTNVLSHMEGWLRLERYADLADGAKRTYPVLTRRESADLAKDYLTELAKAFPSPHLHAGLDELLFTGDNPEAAAAIEKQTKALYYARAARRMIRHVQSLGKTVWMWDDMIYGKNIYRKEGFNDDWPKAAALFPKSTVLAHWWYWGNEMGHPEMIKRVAASGHPFVVASCCRTYFNNYGRLDRVGENQSYLAAAGLRHGAFGYVCTHWESDFGSCFESTWPLLAMSAAQAWNGTTPVDAEFHRRLSFTLTGDADGALGGFLQTISGIEKLLEEKGLPPNGVRSFIITMGPARFWQRVSQLLDAADRRHLRALVARAEEHRRRLGQRDPGLVEALRIPITLFTAGLDILDAFDQAWGQYHRAALIERDPKRQREFARRIEKTLAAIRTADRATATLAQAFRRMEKAGHTPYDAYVLGLQRKNLREVTRLIRAAVRDGNGLPYFEKFLFLPDVYNGVNLPQLQLLNTFNTRDPQRRWPIRRVEITARD